jgi:hypothetical protein
MDGYHIKLFWRDGKCILSVNGVEGSIHPWIGKQIEAWQKTPRVWKANWFGKPDPNDERSLNKYMKKKGESHSMNPFKKHKNVTRESDAE